MLLNTILGIAIPAVIGIICLVVIGLILARLYKRATKETALVKTGWGGRKVIMDGGIIAVPLLHEIAKVNMNTLRLSVSRAGEQALITKDRMRVDVACEFYVKVKATEEGVSTAAQTLGNKTFNIAELRDMVEGKLVDVLRAVAAQMTMDSLHENRAHFSQQVQEAAAEGLLKNGLELEGAALTGLDQTPFENLDESNAFNAVGMKALAQVIAESKQRRAQIEADTETAVAETHLAAKQRKLQIDKQEEETRIQTNIEVENLKADEIAKIARQRELAQSASDEARIEREQRTRKAEIDKQRSLEIAEQERQIAISEKSKEESEARAAADTARAAAVIAEESISTNRRVAEAERQKRIAILAAEEHAEEQATGVRVQAAAEKDAAQDRAASMREIAEAEAAKTTIQAEANRTAALAEADGREKLIAAENAVSQAIIAHREVIARLEALPAIIAEMAKPAEKISDIRINHIGGLGGSAGSFAADPASGVSGLPGQGGGLVDQAVGAIGTMALQHPALKALGDSVGLTLGDGLNGILNSAADINTPTDAEVRKASVDLPVEDTALEVSGEEDAA